MSRSAFAWRGGARARHGIEAGHAFIHIDDGCRFICVADLAGRSASPFLRDAQHLFERGVARQHAPQAVLAQAAITLMGILLERLLARADENQTTQQNDENEENEKAGATAVARLIAGFARARGIL